MKLDDVDDRLRYIRDETPLYRRESQVFVFVYEYGATVEQTADVLDIPPRRVRDITDKIDERIERAANLITAAADAGAIPERNDD
jgi:DNA-directed RNA polymerase specialized sigma subunit